MSMKYCFPNYENVKMDRHLGNDVRARRRGQKIPNARHISRLERIAQYAHVPAGRASG